ncbi:hypothetical protein GCM10018953_33050 [Streptosporangium nondiastaticum]|uniref:MauE/DoxX family redox-associated membrane protein n=1 Tax=Streptosporangium nondiastaticum TaxID=35764 RepID=UPI0031F9570E
MQHAAVHAVLACRAFLAVLFIASVHGKARRGTAYRRFEEAVERLLPSWPPARRLGSRRIAALVLAAEAGVPVLVAAPATAPAGLLLGAALLLAFAGVLARAVRAGHDGACHCFGESARPVGRGQVIRNLVLGSAALAAAGLATRGGTAGLEGTLVAVLAGALLAVLVVHAEDVGDLFRSL